jgi:hypothetical protein
MTEPHPELGKPWAAEGESRPSRFRTPLAHAPGHNGGVLYVRDGQGAEGERWVTLCTWNAWVRDTNAAPFKVEEDKAPWHEEEGA